MVVPQLVVLAAAWCGTAGATAPAAQRSAEQPKLVVMIVIDQFPAYLLPRLEKHLSPRGLRLLMERGAWYQQAHYPQAATLTGVGHATLATGGLPAGHGISGNDWYDREHDREVYCVEDPEHQWVGGKSRPDDGTSPRNLTSTTFSDEWRLAAGFEPKVVGISIKDRGSILLAGKLGKAFWYDNQTGSFVSSTYYYHDGKMPEWVQKFNAAKPADKFFLHSWNLLLDPHMYHAAADDRPYEIDLKGLGTTFPHVLGKGMKKPAPDFYRALASSPAGNQLILELARAAIAGEQLGQRGVTDMLLVSLTANDYCGHNFGPESLEYHDMTLQTDRQLEGFFADLDREIGLNRTLIVLSSDHGVAPTPEYLTEQGLKVGRIDPEQIAAEADAALDQAFGPDDWSARFLNPGLFLRQQPMRHHKVPAVEAERVAAEAVRRIPGIAEVFTRSQLASGQVPHTKLAHSVAATFHPQRSPDVIIVQQPYWYLYKEMKKNAGMHGSPYPYDTHVPVLFYGPGIAPGRSTRHVSPTDIAATICHLLGINAPTACEGEVLHEAVTAQPTGPRSMPQKP